MWFMNHIFNAIVRWILLSPLHGLMSKNVLLIAFRGRKSGKEYMTPVQFSQEGKEVWILVGFAEKKRWWHNLTGGATVRLFIKGKWQNGQAIVLRGEADRPVILAGLRLIFRKFPVYQKGYGEIDSSTFNVEDIVSVEVTLD